MHAALAAFRVTDACHRTVTNAWSQTAKCWSSCLLQAHRSRKLTTAVAGTTEELNFWSRLGRSSIMEKFEGWGNQWHFWSRTCKSVSGSWQVPPMGWQRQVLSCSHAAAFTEGTACFAVLLAIVVQDCLHRTNHVLAPGSSVRREGGTWRESKFRRTWWGWLKEGRVKDSPELTMLKFHSVGWRSNTKLSLYWCRKMLRVAVFYSQSYVLLLKTSCCNMSCFYCICWKFLYD